MITVQRPRFSLDYLPSGLHSISNPARAWRVSIATTITAATEEAARSFAECNFTDLARVTSTPRFTLDEDVYDASKLLEPWREPLSAIRFAEHRRHVFRVDDSPCVWLSDGAMAAQCVGEHPYVFELQIIDPCERHPIKLRDMSPCVRLDESRERWMLRCPNGIYLSADYVVAVETACSNVTWWTPKNVRAGSAVARVGDTPVAFMMGLNVLTDSVFDLTEDDEQTWRTVFYELRSA